MTTVGKQSPGPYLYINPCLFGPRAVTSEPGPGRSCFPDLPNQASTRRVDRLELAALSSEIPDLRQYPQPDNINIQ